jgi:hypothetical protein
MPILLGIPLWGWAVGGLAVLGAGEGIRRAGDGAEDLTRSLVVASVAATAAAVVAPTILKAIRK